MPVQKKAAAKKAAPKKGKKKAVVAKKQAPKTGKKKAAVAKKPAQVQNQALYLKIDLPSPVQNQAPNINREAPCPVQNQAHDINREAPCPVQNQAPHINREAPHPEFNEPWRPVEWRNSAKESMLDLLNDCKPEVEHLTILLHGPVGAGKSSFINSTNTVLQSSNKVAALAGSAVSTSFTLQLKTYRLKKSKSGSYYPFQLTDIMGLEPKSCGVHPKDIMSVLQGKVKDGYKFNPVCPLDEENDNFNRNPKPENKVHCLVSVLPADKISMMSQEVILKMNDVRKFASDMGIPQVIVMSMVDRACPLVKEDLKKIYTSKKIKEKMQECSYQLGVPMNCIFPVKNYHEEITNDLNMDILILMAMTNIVSFANDYAEEQVFTD